MVEFVHIRPTFRIVETFWYEIYTTNIFEIHLSNISPPSVNWYTICFLCRTQSRWTVCENTKWVFMNDWDCIVWYSEDYPHESTSFDYQYSRFKSFKSHFNPWEELSQIFQHPSPFHNTICRDCHIVHKHSSWRLFAARCMYRISTFFSAAFIGR